MDRSIEREREYAYICGLKVFLDTLSFAASRDQFIRIKSCTLPAFLRFGYHNVSRPFSPFHWFKTGNFSIWSMAKEWALSIRKLPCSLTMTTDHAQNDLKWVNRS